MFFNRCYRYNDGRFRVYHQIDKRCANELFEAMYCKFYGYDSIENNLSEMDECLIMKVSKKMFQADLSDFNTHKEAIEYTEYMIIDYVLYQFAHYWLIRTKIRHQMKIHWIFSNVGLDRWDNQTSRVKNGVGEMLWAFDLSKEKIHSMIFGSF